VADCRAAGIAPVMITGDHPGAACSIARRLGIVGPDDALITGEERAALTVEQLEARIDQVRLYARVSPARKIKIVRAPQDDLATPHRPSGLRARCHAVQGLRQRSSVKRGAWRVPPVASDSKRGFSPEASR